MTMLSRLAEFIRPHVRSDAAYAIAMDESDDLLRRMREISSSPNAVRSLMANIWLQRHNVPFVTTVHEAVAEMQAPMVGTTAKPPPLKDLGK